jgi:predicted MFS family arabinose efflux permease
MADGVWEEHDVRTERIRLLAHGRSVGDAPTIAVRSLAPTCRSASPPQHEFRSSAQDDAVSPRWRSLAALTLARAAIGFQFQAVAAVAPLLAGELAIDNTQLGWLIGLYLLPGVAFALPGGLLGRRFGDKRLVLVGLALMAIGGGGLALAESFIAANVARVVSGVGAVILNVLLTKMVTDLFEDRERLLAMSVLINSWPIGIGIALLVVGPLGELSGWRWGVATSAAFALAGLLMVAAVHRPGAAASPIAAPTTGIGLDVLVRREWRLLAIGSLPWLLYNAAFQIALSFMPSFFVGNGFGIAHAGSLMAVNAAMFVVGVQLGGFLLKRTTNPDRLCHAMILVWCATLLLIAAGHAPLPWLVIGGVLGGIPAAALVSIPGEFLRPESRSAGVGVFYTIYYGGCAVLPTLAGALYDAAGGRAALWMSTGLAFGAALTLALFRRAMSS